jgi:recombination protein RecR
MTKPKEFEHLIDAIRSLPNIGLKSANKIAHFILKQDDKYIRTFILKIKEAHDYVKICCNYYFKNIIINSFY